MKSFLTKANGVALAFVMVVLMAAAMPISASAKASPATISADGVLTWTSYPKAKKYEVTFGKKHWITTKRRVDLPYEAYKHNIPSGPRNYKIVAKDKNNKTLCTICNYRFTVRPKGVQITKVQSKKTMFKIRWQKQTRQITGYQILITEGDHYTEKCKNVSKQKTSLIIKDMPTGVYNGFKVRVYQKVNGKKYYSKWSNLKVAKHTLHPASEKEAAKMFYDFASKKGLSEVQIAAILGCYKVETGLDPTGVEGIWNQSKYQINNRKIKAQKHDFLMSRIDEDYAKRFPSITKASIGFGGWTDTAAMPEGKGFNSLLCEYAKAHDGDWYDMHIQLGYWWEGSSCMPDTSYPNWHGRADFESAVTVEDAVDVYLSKRIEGWDVPIEGVHNSTTYSKTIDAAKEYYTSILNGEFD